MGPFVTTVGVFVDEQKEKVWEIGCELCLNVLQFHGKESASYCNFFKKRFKVIKTIFPGDNFSFEKLQEYKVDAFLFDVEWERKLKGEKRLSEEFLEKVREFSNQGVRIIISGGLTPENVVSVVKKVSPYAVDVASGVEREIGKKDEGLVKQFIRNIKSYEGA